MHTVITQQNIILGVPDMKVGDTVFITFDVKKQQITILKLISLRSK